MSPPSSPYPRRSGAFMSIPTQNKQGEVPWRLSAPHALLQTATVPDCVVDGVAALLDLIFSRLEVRHCQNIRGVRIDPLPLDLSETHVGEPPCVLHVKPLQLTHHRHGQHRALAVVSRRAQKPLLPGRTHPPRGAASFPSQAYVFWNCPHVRRAFLMSRRTAGVLLSWYDTVRPSYLECRTVFKSSPYAEKIWRRAVRLSAAAAVCRRRTAVARRQVTLVRSLSTTVRRAPRHHPKKFEPSPKGATRRAKMCRHISKRASAKRHKRYKRHERYKRRTRHTQHKQYKSNLCRQKRHT